MDPTPVTDPSSISHPLARFRKASQAVHAVQVLDEVLTRTIAELYSALDAEAASVALLNSNNDEIVLHAAGPVAEAVSGLHLPPGHGIIGWTIANGQSVIVNDVSSDDRFWPDVDGYSGFETRSVLCSPLVSGNRIIGALEVLNKVHGDFTSEDLNFLDAFGAVAASAIENARRFRQEQRRRREADALRHAWEALTTPRDLEALLDVILDQLARLIEYRSASILLVTEEDGLELSASRGLKDLVQATRIVNQLGLDVKVQTMQETGQPILIPDTHDDPRWRHFPSNAHVRSWIGVPLLVKGHLIGTLNVDHDQPGFYNAEHVRLASSLAHQAAIAIENSRLYATTREATLKLADQARRTVTLYETSRALLSGLELDHAALRELVTRIIEMTQARYAILDILPQNSGPGSFISVGFDQVAEADVALLQRHILDKLSSEREIIRGAEFSPGDLDLAPGTVLSAILGSFVAVAIHARGRVLGRLLLAGKRNNRPFDHDDQALALTLTTNLAGAIENASLYHDIQQRLRELTALYEISRAVTGMFDIKEIYTQLALQVAELLDVERCAFFIYKEGRLECQAPGYGIPPEWVSRLSVEIKKDEFLYDVIHAAEPVVCNDVSQSPNLAAQRPLLDQLGVRRMLSRSIPLDEQQVGLLVAADKRGEVEFTEQDRHLISIIAHQVDSVLQRARLQSRQRENLQIRSALLQVSQAISSLTNLDKLLEAVARTTHQLVGCDHCIIAPWEERQSAFVPRAQSGLDPASTGRLVEQPLRPDELFFIDQVTETRAPLFLDDREIRQALPDWIKSSLIVPLVVQERVVGLIIVAYVEKRRSPGQREISLVTGIARQAAIAIENANLYEDLQLHARRLERAYSDLKALDERKTQFIQNMAHELRTPFTLVKGYVEMLFEEQLGDLNDSQKEALGAISSRIQTLSALINDIVAMQTIDATSLNLGAVEVDSLLQTVLESIQLRVPDVHTKTEFSPDLPSIEADPVLLGRALRHLLDNAVKFSPDGGEIIARAWQEGEMLTVEITDQGIGIPAEALPYIFDRFYQVDGSTTRKFGGAGLGLAIAKQIIEAHGGQINAHSVEGEGSTFYFTLPLSSGH